MRTYRTVFLATMGGLVLAVAALNTAFGYSPYYSQSKPPDLVPVGTVYYSPYRYHHPAYYSRDLHTYYLVPILERDEPADLEALCRFCLMRNPRQEEKPAAKDKVKPTPQTLTNPYYAGKPLGERPRSTTADLEPVRIVNPHLNGDEPPPGLINPSAESHSTEQP